MKRTQLLTTARSHLLWSGEVLPLLLAASVALIVTIRVRPFLIGVQQNYPEFVVGRIAWNAANKSGDYLTLLLFVATTLAAGVFFNALFKILLGRCRNEDARSAVRAQFAFALLPAVWWATEMLIRGSASSGLLNLYLVLAFFSVVFSARLLYSRDPLDKPSVHALLGSPLLSVIFAVFAVLGIFTAFGRTIPLFLDAIGIDRYRTVVQWGLHIGVLGTLALAVSFLFIPGSLTVAKKRLFTLLLVVQLPLPLLVFVLTPPFWRVQGQIVEGYETSSILLIVLGLLVAVSIGRWAKCFGRILQDQQDEVQTMRSVLIPSCLVYIPVFLHTPRLGLPVLPSDFYHSGEGYLPWQQWSEFGKVPFWDLSPVHGLIHVVSGFLGDLFFDGTAAAFGPAHVLLLSLVLAIAYLGLSAIIDPLSAALVLSLAPLNLKFAPILALFIILTHPTLIGRPLRWLSAWIVGSYAVVLYSITYGAAFAIASLPMAAFSAYGQLKRDPRVLAKFAIAVVGILVLLGVFTPLGKMSFGLIAHILQNARVNAVAYGVPWEMDRPPNWSHLFAFEPWWKLLRVGWLAIALLAGFLWWRELSKAKPRNTSGLWMFGTLALMGLTILVYAFGRIDAARYSRPGIALLFFLLVFLIGVLVANRRSPNYPRIIMICAAGIGLLHVIHRPLPRMKNLVAHPSHVINATREQLDFHGRQLGLPNLGRITVKKEDLNHLRELQGYLSGFLKPGETYLDLTNNAAHYYLLGYPVPTLEANPYNLTTTGRQHRAIELLATSSPPVVLAYIDGRTILHDGGPLSLRAPLLYQYIVTSYVPIIRGRFIFLLEPERAKTVPVVPPKYELTLSNFSDRNWKQGVLRQGTQILLGKALDGAAIKPRDNLVFAHSGARTVVKRVDRRVWLSGPPLQPELDGYPNVVRVKNVAGDESSEQRLYLLDQAFRQGHLRRIPVAWGRSWETLSSQVVDAGSLALHNIVDVRNLRKNQDGSFTPMGNDPGLLFDLSRLGLSGREAYFLRLDFYCVAPNSAPEPELELYWNDFSRGLNEAAVVRFFAADGPLAIPLGANPRWLLNDNLQRLRIDLRNPQACRSFKVENIQFFNWKHGVPAQQSEL